MGSNYKTILAAVDGSKEAKQAFEKAINLALKDQAKLVISYVIDNRTTGTIEHYDRTYAEQTERYGFELLEQYKSEALEQGVTDVKTDLGYGSPKVRIPKEVAEKHKVDLIIAGATGVNAVERFLIGSVSESIARRATCDVMIVRN
ncbi:universal stress protein family [Halalkalibacter wakoensis JCM 9140]|uniref:Universal stress protein n=1 Tax=Halalkalibacter wakoensis JCM 9140 TaxID=1236970 RepID=W4Q4B6_9BACI|nr:universal stress protein [Halalkalibacter wakoensis]GAE26548.1 universal stress protein family [Halalkalibacter wakoensis JCM 9140]